MLRYILKVTFKDSCNGCEGTVYHTIDGDAERVEDALQSGGRSETGYEHTELVGVEIITGGE
jgi:hypothetical protein